MILRRFELKRFLAGEREVLDPEDVLTLLKYIQKFSISCTIVASGHGPMRQCSIIEAELDKIKVYTRVPVILYDTIKISDICIIEADSNTDFLEKKSDEEERMSRIR